MHRLNHSCFKKFLEKSDGLFFSHLAVKVWVLLEVLVQPLDGLGPREAVVIGAHVASVIQVSKNFESGLVARRDMVRT